MLLHAQNMNFSIYDFTFWREKKKTRMKEKVLKRRSFTYFQQQQQQNMTVKCDL